MLKHRVLFSSILLWMSFTNISIISTILKHGVSPMKQISLKFPDEQNDKHLLSKFTPK